MQKPRRCSQHPWTRNHLLTYRHRYLPNGIYTQILMRYGMSESRPVATPLDPNQPLRKAEPGMEIADISKYQSIIGSLMYAVSGTRPDLAFTVTLLSQFSSAPNEEHMQCAKRVLRYLSGIVNWLLHYPWSPTTPFRLTCYANASYANSLDDRKLLHP